MLARDGGSQKVTFHKLPAQSASPLSSLAAGQSISMPEAVYSVYFETQVHGPSSRLIAGARGGNTGCRALCGGKLKLLSGGERFRPAPVCAAGHKQL